jgi:hypothetical protein
VQFNEQTAQMPFRAAICVIHPVKPIKKKKVAFSNDHPKKCLSVFPGDKWLGVSLRGEAEQNVSFL